MNWELSQILLSKYNYNRNGIEKLTQANRQLLKQADIC